MSPRTATRPWWPSSRTTWSRKSSSSANGSAASSATSTKAGSPKSSPACNPRSSISGSSATASSTSPTSWTRWRSSTSSNPAMKKAGNGRDRDRDRDKPPPKIEELLKEGQEILVQVVKEPLGTKGARLTSHVTMAGRFLVFMPTVDHVGVSRKIESREERGRLRGIVREFRESRGFTGGVIIRTAAVEPAQGRHRQGPRSVPHHLDGDPPEDRVAAGAGRRLPRSEPGQQAAAGPADRGVPGDPHRQRARVPARARARRAHHAEPGAEGEAVHEGVSRSSTSTASRPRSTRRSRAKCG